MRINKNKLSPEQRETLLQTLQNRFEKNKQRHPGIEWMDVKIRLEAHAGKL